MARNEKADLRGIGSNEKWLTGNQRRIFNSDYRHFPHSVQCKKCFSDYMRASFDGYCQRCLQLTEYIIRERPEILAKIGKREAI